MTAAQSNAFVKYRNDCAEKNLRGVRRWQKERKALRQSNLKNLTVLVRQ
jgi:hypothetical protein